MKRRMANEGAGDRWRAFLKLIQAIWEQGCIPQQMQWVIVVLLPKGGGDFHGIGLLKPFWKVIEVLINGRFEVIEFHYCLHRFLKGGGMGTATLGAKLAQQLALLEQETLYEVFIDLKKM